MSGASFHGIPEVTIKLIASVSGGSGIATCYASDNSLSNGAKLFKEIRMINVSFDNGDPDYANIPPIIDNDGKTISIRCKRRVSNVLSILGNSVIGSFSLNDAPNDTAITVYVTGILD